MKILLTNDDGYSALGIQVLRETLLDFGHEVFIVAPFAEQSGMSHAVSFFKPLAVKQVSSDTWAVNGTPADSAVVGLTGVLREKGIEPDFVISGINAGLNVADCVNYSGTVGAATEATFLGYKAIAVSMDNEWKDHPTVEELETGYKEVAETVGKLLPQLKEDAWLERQVLNINHPGKPSNGIKLAECNGFSFYTPKITRLEGFAGFQKEMSYYIIGGDEREPPKSQYEDASIVSDGFTSICFITAKQSSTEYNEKLELIIDNLTD